MRKLSIFCVFYAMSRKASAAEQGENIMERIALLYGWGKLPRLWAEEAKRKGYKVIAFPLQEEKTIDLHATVEAVYPVHLGLLSEVIELILKNKVKKVVMLGKVRKSYLFKNPELDSRMKKVLNNLDNLNDNNIMFALAREFNKEGIEVLKQSTFLEDLLPVPGVLTAGKPDPEIWSDMKYGLKIARKIAEMDIGQTVIVKDRSVLAVEAIEGTDQTIKRGGDFGGSGVIMAKASNPEHDFRFDIPTIGLKTLENLEKISARGLVVEAGRTFLLDKNQFIEKAENAGIAVVAMDSKGG